MALMSKAAGMSVITETIFENRFRHVDEMRGMKANIKIFADSAVIKGEKRLCGAEVEATDLRAGAALTLLSLAAEGESRVNNVRFIDRGYQNFEGALQSLGADIRRENRK
jgi:UDP-N-acetylglucosamine 1-carboxyvinyltransferase